MKMNKTILLMLTLFAVSTNVLAQFISDIQVVESTLGFNYDDSHDGYERIKTPPGEDVVIDLNEGAGGKFVFLFAKYTSNIDDAITNIIMYDEDGKDYNPRNGLTINNGDFTYHGASYDDIDNGGGNLNRGVGGSPNLWLYYTKDGEKHKRNFVTEGSRILGGLRLIKSRDTEITQPNANFVKYHFSDQNADANKGTYSTMHIYIEKLYHTHSVSRVDYSIGIKYCSCGMALRSFPEPVLEYGVYQISNIGELCWFRDHVNNTKGDCNACAVLTKDIDMKPYINIAKSWDPIGSIDSEANWCGTFDGAGHTISNLGISDKYAGFFCKANGTIKNLHIKGVSSGWDKAAMLVAMSDKEIVIDNCTIEGDVSAFDDAAGFVNVIGSGCAKITNCESNTETKIMSETTAAGIATSRSDNENAVQIDRCIVRGTVRSGTYSSFAITDSGLGSVTNCLIQAEALGTKHAEELSAEPVSGYVINSSDKLYCRRNVSFFNYDFARDSREVEGNIKFDTQLDEGLQFTDANQITKGEICYYINKFDCNGTAPTWFQTIGEDLYPKPGYDGMVAYQYINCDYLRAYSNYKAFAEDHQEGGHCYECVDGEYDPKGARLQCITCGWKSKNRINADKCEQQIVCKASCEDRGLKIYKCTISDRGFSYVYEEKINSLGGQHEYDPNVLWHCKNCGALLDIYSDPYWNNEGICYINSESDFVNFHKMRNEDIKTVILMTDLNFKNYPKYLEFAAMHYGTTDLPINGVTIDGMGHTIKGMYSACGEYAGVFGDAKNCTFKNMKFEDCYVSGNNGALLCNSAENCTFDNITINGVINARGMTGSLCINAKECTFTNCHNKAFIRNKDGYIGGLAAYVEGGSFERCTNSGHIDGSRSSYVGGLAGNYFGVFDITDCANYGTVTGYANVGGFVGGNKVPEDINPACRVYSNLNVGKVTITNKDNSRGTFSGYCDLPEDFKLLINDYYSTTSKAYVGNMESKVGTGTIFECDNEQLASGEICYRLNGKKSTESSVWHQELGKDAYPYPYGSSLLYVAHANNTEFFVTPGCTIEKLDLMDATYFETPVPFNVGKISYTRDASVKKDFYATLVLPFAFSDERLKIMEYDYYDTASGKVYFKEVTTTKPNVPYLVRVADTCDEDEVTISFNEENAMISVTSPSLLTEEDNLPDLTTGFYGTYISHTLYGGLDIFCFSSKYGDFRRANTTSGTKISPFRCYFKIGEEGSSSAPAKLVLAYSDNTEDNTETTDIDASNFVEIDNAPIYNLNGQQIGTSTGNLKSGIYIQNGKKILIK